MIEFWFDIRAIERNDTELSFIKKKKEWKKRKINATSCGKRK